MSEVLLKIVPVAEARHTVLRLHAGDVLPDTLLVELRKRQVTGGWLRLSGVVADVELCAFSSEIEGPGGTKRISGPLQAVTLEGSLGVADGDVAVDLRVVLARETDRGLETIAGQLLRARVIGLEGSLTILAETVIPRALDKAAGIRLMRDDSIVTPVASAAASPVATPVAPHTAPDRPSAAAPPPARPSVPSAAPSAPAVPPAPASWSDAVAASNTSPPPRPTGAPGTFGRPPRRVVESEDGPYPVAGDTVEHFAFGSCEVLKSDGDRLHVRMKDGRIREIAIEMLKVTTLGPDATDGGEKQRYRLDRRV
jgi:predicted DNA-binding protein with PD1-like motif